MFAAAIDDDGEADEGNAREDGDEHGESNDEDIGGGLSAGGGTRAGDRWQVGGCCSLVRTEILKTMKNAFIVKSFLLFVNLHLALDYVLTISHT